MRFRTFAAVVPLLLASTLILPGASNAADEPKPGEAAPPAAAPTKKPKKPRARIAPAPRTAWMLGLGFGYGNGAPSLGTIDPDKEWGGMTQVRLGYAAGPTTIAGIEYMSWSATPDTNSWKMTGVGPSVTWYWSKQGYVRGMAGVGIVDVSLDAADPDVPGSPLTHHHAQDDGFAFAAAAGYEWRLYRRWGVSPEIQWLRVNAGDDVKGRIFAAGVQFNYYY